MSVAFIVNMKMPGTNMPKRSGCCLYLTIFLLTQAAWTDTLSQPLSRCDSLVAVAWNKFHDTLFKEAKDLTVACVERNDMSKEARLAAHLLLAHIAFDEKDTTQAVKHIKAICQEMPNYEPPQSLKPKKKFLEFYKKIMKPCLPPPPPKLIILPETSVLDWLVVNLGGGTNLGKAENAKNPLLLHARFGFELAELEFRTVEIINRLSQSYPNQVKTEIPTLAFKITLPEGRFRRGWPGFTTVFRTDVGLWDFDSDNLKADSLIYRRDLDSFLLFLSKTWGPIQLHAGGSYSFLEARIDTQNTESGFTKKEWEGPNYFGALQVQASSLAMLMITFEPIAEYKDLKNGLQAPATQGLLSIDVRAFPLPVLAIDAGVNWRIKNPKGIPPKDEDRFRIKLGVTMGLSLPKIFHELRGSSDE